MRTVALPLALLSLVLPACSSDLPSAPAAERSSVAASHGAIAVELPFRGTVQGRETDLEVGPPTYVVRIDGGGTATQLGRFTELTVVMLDVTTFAGPEEMTLSAANGDLITATGIAQGAPSGDGVTLLSVETMTITGGTGRFDGASGHFVVRRTFDPVTFTSSGSFEGSITLAR